MSIETAEVETRTVARLGLADRLQPVLLLASIGAGLALGRMLPGIADLASSAVSIGVFVLIALVMLNVNPRNVSTVFRRRRFLVAAVVLNFVINPVIAWALGNVFLAGHDDLRVGLILFLVTPCIGWYLIFTELAGGDAELGVGLLGINVILQILLLPVYLALFVGGSATVDVGTIVQSVLLFLLLPAMVAASARAWWGSRGRGAGDEQERLHISQFKTATLAVVITSMFASQADVIFDELGAVQRLIVPMVLFFGLAFGLALFAAGQLRLPHEQTALLVFTTTSRNSEASLAIAATAFASPMVALTVALGPVIELPLLIVMTRLLQRRARGSFSTFWDRG